jgi:hypothetical protein
MNWEAIGAAGDLISGIAVLVTLAYLAVQLRHARRERQRALGQGRAEGTRDLIALSHDDRVNRLRVRADSTLGFPPSPFVATLMERVGMTREEAHLVWQHSLAWLNHYLQIIPHVDELSEVERRQLEIAIGARYGRGYDSLFYGLARSGIHPDAVRYFDAVITRFGPPGS